MEPPGPLILSGAQVTMATTRPCHDLALIPPLQTIGALSGIAAVIVGVRASGVFGTIVWALGAGLLATAVVLNGVLAASTAKSLCNSDRRFHSLSLVNTLIGYRFEPFWRFWVVFFNLVLAAISLTAATIRHELDAAWGCYSGSLPIARLTGLVCTLDSAPELCFDVGEPRSYLGPDSAPSDLPSSANAVACGPGSRHADLQDAIWVPLGLFLVEWLLIVMWAYRHKDYVRLDGTSPECKVE